MTILAINQPQNAFLVVTFALEQLFTAGAGKWKVRPIDISWVATVTLNGRPKPVCNRCVVEMFGGGFVFSLAFKFQSVLQLLS